MEFGRLKIIIFLRAVFSMFNVDFKDIKKLTVNLKNCHKNAFPKTIWYTLNRMARDTALLSKKEIMHKFFNLRNSYIQGSVGYKSEKTFDISSMQSFAGQFSSYKGKATGQLEKQEYGKPVISKGAYTFAATPAARGGSYNKTVRKSNLLTSLNVKKLSDLVANPTSNPSKRIAQAQAFAIRNKTTVNVLLTNSKGHKGIYRVSKKSVSLLYDLRNRKTVIKRSQWLKTSSDRILMTAERIYISEANKRLEKELSRGLSHS